MVASVVTAAPYLPRGCSRLVVKYRVEQHCDLDKLVRFSVQQSVKDVLQIFKGHGGVYRLS